MINGKRIAVVLPAYNAEKTLEATVREVPDLVDVCILVDDHSSDRTIEVAKQLGLQFFQHDRNYGRAGRTAAPTASRPQWCGRNCGHPPGCKRPPDPAPRAR